MSCQNCFKDNIEAIIVFSSRCSLVIFLLDRVLNIKDLKDRYCFCKKIIFFRVWFANFEWFI